MGTFFKGLFGLWAIWFIYTKFIRKKFCKYCNKRSMFWTGANSDVCGVCYENHVMFKVSQFVRIMEDSVKIIDNSKNEKTVISRCGLIIKMFNENEKEILDLTGGVDKNTIINNCDVALNKCGEIFETENQNVNDFLEIESCPKKRKKELEKSLKRTTSYIDELPEEVVANAREAVGNIQELIKSHEIQIIIEKADLLIAQEKEKQAVSKYQEAKFELDKFGENFPHREELEKEIKEKLGKIAV